MSTCDRMIDLLPYHLQSGDNTQKIMKGLSKLLDEVSELMGQVSEIGSIYPNASERHLNKNLFDGVFSTLSTSLVTEILDSNTFRLTNPSGGAAGVNSSNILPKIEFETNQRYTFSGNIYEVEESKNLRLTVKYTDGTTADIAIPTITESQFLFISAVDKIIDYISYSFSVSFGNTTIKNFMIEKGIIKTDYEPYVNIGTPTNQLILNKTGEIVNEYRNGESDELFRQRIITKIISNISGGDIETINGVGRILLSDNYVGVIEKHNRGIDKEPAALTLVYDFTNISQPPIAPFKTVIAGGISLDTAIQIYAPVMDMYDPSTTNLAQFAFLA